MSLARGNMAVATRGKRIASPEALNMGADEDLEMQRLSHSVESDYDLVVAALWNWFGSLWKEVSS